MGRISSTVKKISDVHFEQTVSNRVRSDVVKVVCFGQSAYMLTKDGRIFTDCELGRKAVFTGTGSDFHGVRALRALGIITAEEQHQHGEYKRRHDANYARYRAVYHAANELSNAGFKLTAKQKEKLRVMKDNINLVDLPWFVQKEAQRKIGADGAKA